MKLLKEAIADLEASAVPFDRACAGLRLALAEIENAKLENAALRLEIHHLKAKLNEAILSAPSQS